MYMYMYIVCTVSLLIQYVLFSATDLGGGVFPALSGR